MGAFDLLARAAKGVKNAPFFSKADVVLDELQRNKGTGDEFLTEIVKKGAKPTELKDRGIDRALKGKPKMTKAEVQKIFEEKAPPRVQEQVLGGDDYRKALDQQAKEMIGDRNVTFDDLYGGDREMARANVDSDFGYEAETQYERYRTPGGENYREILLKLPKRGLNESQARDLMLFEADIARGAELSPYHQRRYAELKEKQNAQDYYSAHFDGVPNILAHIRVQDFKTPDGKKVLLVDEIQSDMHQEGRKKGYRSALSELPSGYEVKSVLLPSGSQEFRVFDPEGRVFSSGMSANTASRNALENLNVGNKVPDAPFKKNWHELSMKRVLDYAAENGYDSVAITPGAEQAKRYDLSKQVGAIEYSKSGDDNYKIKVYDPVGQPMNLNIPNTLDASGLQQYIGKEMAEKVASQATREQQSLSGIDLQVGGEGMKGFYDKILPDYLNNYGKQYGAQVGSTKLMVEPQKATFPMPPPGQERVQVLIPAEFMDAHSFDITPQMREQIQTKGQPLYSKIGVPGAEAAAGTGAAAAGSQIFNEDNEQTVQNPVHFTENPDAMLLELMQRN